VREPTADEVRVIVIMGVAGAGKTTVGQALAQAIGWEFHDADELHSPENIAKMHRGEGLTDDDRRPWLAALRALIATILHNERHAVLACSALKQSYRRELVPADVPATAVRFAYLNVPTAELRRRLAARAHHFAPPELLTSQLATLEPPSDALWVDGNRPVETEVQTIRDAFGL
jgi:gluconokinase